MKINFLATKPHLEVKYTLPFIEKGEGRLQEQQKSNIIWTFQRLYNLIKFLLTFKWTNTLTYISFIRTKGSWQRDVADMNIYSKGFSDRWLVKSFFEIKLVEKHFLDFN